MGDASREHSDDDQDPKEEFLVEYQEETQLETQDIQLEAGIPQDTANKNLFKHKQDEQNFLVTTSRGMAYLHGTATKMTVCIENAQHPLCQGEYDKEVIRLSTTLNMTVTRIKSIKKV
ncbi:hypothetical protein O181_036593 [Austropuccinia psidii MF-1]|uniref:Uncharacterized protein n=1 Tax=Austropuccinia psidii MF-1 TaxID=1389203 RepID=A0A9Q3D7R4_9BASI|nr:hypothetical protein [Austropuccinia psidii MF-1]